MAAIHSVGMPIKGILVFYKYLLHNARNYNGVHNLMETPGCILPYLRLLTKTLCIPLSKRTILTCVADIDVNVKLVIYYLHNLYEQNFLTLSLCEVIMLTTDEQQSSASTDEPLLYTIDQVATRTELTKRTLRYYEEVGLLPPTERTEGNYRRYSEADVQRLQRIKNLRNLLGFTLSEIRTLLEAEDERGLIKIAYRQETDEPTKIAHLDHADELIRGQLQLIEQKLAGLEQMRRLLVEKLERHEQARQALSHSE